MVSSEARGTQNEFQPGAQQSRLVNVRALRRSTIDETFFAFFLSLADRMADETEVTAQNRALLIQAHITQ